ncbi:response regulator [bacterium]|nr:response regulator [bacterium]
MLRLLIIDDESTIRTGVATYFPWASLGIEVAGACRDGLEALALMEKTQVDLVLCDIGMPRMNGIAFAEAVRGRDYRCDIVFISAHKDFDYAKRAIELGVREYIVKPAGYEELFEVFSKLVREWEFTRERQLASERAAQPIAAESALAPSATLPERTRRLIEADLAAITLPAAAEKLGMSPNYLSAKLRQECGKTFSDLLLEARMARASVLLQDPASRVGQVARLVGYANTKSFIRAYRLSFGGSPTAIRRSQALSKAKAEDQPPAGRP